MIKASADQYLESKDSVLAQNIHFYPNNLLGFLVRHVASSLPKDVHLLRTGFCYNEDMQPIVNSKAIFVRSDTKEPLFGLEINNKNQPILLI